MDNIERLKEIIAESDNIVFFGGAGVSTESGIPDFRSVDGLYNQKYKYPPEKKPSRVVDILVQVGRTGVLTPKAVIEPIRLAGTTVTNATLHNQDVIANLGVNIGDTVLVQKAGEIIPAVIEVVKKESEGYFRLPETCPACGAPVERDEDGAAIRCTGAECPAQRLRNIVHSEGVPKCSCGGIVKPDVVLYEEGLDNTILNKAVKYIHNAEVLIIGGTSLVVYPAAGLIDYFKGKYLVVINKSPTSRDTYADLLIQDSIGKVFSMV